jgi:hypothetical protein
VKINFYRLLKILFLVLIPSQFAISQSKSTVGIELGIAFSQFKTGNDISQYGEIANTTIKPVFSPLIGVSKDWQLTKHLRIITGLQYLMTGKRSYTYTYYPVSASYSQEWETIKLHKLSLPVALGYEFKLGNFQPFLYLGLRPNILLAGSKYSKFHEIVVLSPGDENSIDFNDRQNVFEKNEYYIPPKRIFLQYCLGLSTSISRHLKININYNIGHNYYTNIIVVRGNYSTYSWREKISIPSSDYLISIKYILNTKKVAQNKGDKKE